MIRDFKNEVETMSADEWLGIIAILFIVMAAICVISLIIKKSADAKNASCPLQRMNARVVDKQQLPGNTIRSISTMWVLFEMENGMRKRFVIPATKENMVIGDVGTLTWQGEAMVSFNRAAYGVNQAPAWSGSGTVANTTPSSTSQGYIPAWKRVEMEEAKKAQTAEQEQCSCRKCIFCGAEMKADQRFCGQCGRRKN